MPPRQATIQTSLPAHMKPTGPVWKGPCDTGPQGGITVSLMQKFLACRARFKAYALEGWRAAPKFNHRIFFGSMWHAAEESFARDGDPQTAVEVALDYAEVAAEREENAEFREDIRKWWNVLKVTFPEYVKYWALHPEVQDRTPLLQEQVFDVPYKLPSGRTVRLRGRWDGVDLVGTGVDRGVYLFETKTKGDVDEIGMLRQLTFDIQTMTYLAALGEYQKTIHGRVPADFERNDNLREPIKGVRYNVIRRPLSGGKGTIVRHKPTKSNPEGETEADYYERLRAYIVAEPASYFFRWNVKVTPEDITTFKREFLNPFLEFVIAWYEIQCGVHYPVERWDSLRYAFNWRTPYGLTSEIVDGYGSDLDHYITSGSTVGLVRTGELFTELKG